MLPLKINSNSSTVYDCNIFELPKFETTAGNITSLNNNIDIPFETKRIYYLYDVPGGVDRGGHAHKDLKQILVAVSGSFDIILDDGVRKKTVSLNRPFIGLLLAPGIWRELTNFTSGAICLVLASHKYDEKDYIRYKEEFLTWKKLH